MLFKKVIYTMPSEKRNLIFGARKAALIAVFAALTIALNLSPVKFPAPYAPFLIYQIWEIPITAVFFFFGFLAGVFVALINTLVLLAVFPGMLPTGPFYNFVAIVSMLLGMWLGTHLISNLKYRSRLVMILILTVLGIIFRVAVMSFVNWAFLRYPPPIGFSFTEEAIRLLLPLLAVFNATLSLYTIPLGYVVTEAIKRRAKIVLRF